MDLKDTTTRIVLGIVALILLIGGWWLFTQRTSAPSDSSTNTSGNTDTGLGTNPGADEITVGDQPAGDSVRVTTATLSETSWIAVRDEMRIYGAARRDAGMHENITIRLLRNTSSGTTYSVVVYTDDGDRKFDHKKDTLVDGMSASFTALNGD